MASEETKEGQGTKKKSPLLTIIIVAALMVVEGAAVFALVALSGLAPQGVKGETLEGQKEAEENKTVEILLIEEHFNNNQSGRIWRWDVEAYLQVKKKHEAFVTEKLERHKAELRANIAQIVRKAMISQLQEPDSRTLTRQIEAMCREVFGVDSSDESPRFERVIIAKCQGMPLPQ